MQSANGLAGRKICRQSSTGCRILMKSSRIPEGQTQTLPRRPKVLCGNPGPCRSTSVLPLSNTAISVSRGRMDGSSPTACLQRSASMFVQPRPEDEASCRPVTNLTAACPCKLIWIYPCKLIWIYPCKLIWDKELGLKLRALELFDS